jgi:Trp operon repressor
VLAGPPSASVEMQKALAQAELGPDDLRRFVHRTRMIYQLSYAEVMQRHLASKATGNARIASADEPSSRATPADRP